MITLLIVGFTVLVSYLAFGQREMAEKLRFHPVSIVHHRQYHRMVSHVLVHAGWSHLLVNMLVLYMFGTEVERSFLQLFGRAGALWFVLLYAGGAVASTLHALVAHRDNYYYSAVGASGAVSATLFTYVFLYPWNKLYFFGIVPLPGILFAAGYLVYSWIMGRRKSDLVAHDAHFLGALFGILFPVLLKPSLLGRFLDQLTGLM